MKYSELLEIDSVSPLEKLRQPLSEMANELRLQDMCDYMIREAPQILFSRETNIALRMLSFLAAPDVDSLRCLTRDNGNEYIVKQLLLYNKYQTEENRQKIINMANAIV